MSIRRRYEILLPLQFNDARDVPDELQRTNVLGLDCLVLNYLFGIPLPRPPF